MGDSIKDIVKDRFVSDNSNVIVACNDSGITGFAIIQYIHRNETPLLKMTHWNGELVNWN